MSFSWLFGGKYYPQRLAQRHTRAAIATLVKALSDEQHGVRAALALLDRGWGRSRAEVEEPETPLEGLGDAELEKAVAVLRRQVACAELRPQQPGGERRRRRRRGRRRRGARMAATADGPGITRPR
jgi:hypothetical protein